MTTLKSVCVFCGSNSGTKPDYKEAAIQLGREMAHRDIALIYGGAAVGLMGAVADACLDAGGTVTGIIPQSLIDKEIAHKGLTNMFVVRDMHERKAMMAEKSDGFIALPGGFGTLEELFEMLTGAQLGFHKKPCSLYNVAGYYDALNQFLDEAGRSLFMKPEHRAILLNGNTAPQVLDAMAAYTPPTVSKWIRQ